MKLRPLTMIVSLLSLTRTANCSRCHRRTLSVTAKKPASVAGFLYLRPNSFPWQLLFFPWPDLHTSLNSPKFITQTPSSL
jgi:hypothetical protein